MQEIRTPAGETQYISPQNVSARPYVSVTELGDFFPKHNELYGSRVPIKGWREPLFVTTSSIRDIDLDHLVLGVSTSYHAQAHREGFAETGELPVTVQGLVLSSDEYLVLGVRRGSVQGDKISGIPLGYANARVEGHPIFANLYKESVEEAGVMKRDVKNSRIIGCQTDPEFTKGINIVAVMESTLPLWEIQDRHVFALEIYQRAQAEAIAAGRSGRREAKQAVLEAGYPNKDAGDHNPLVGVPVTGIKDLLKQTRMAVDGEVFPFMGITYGALHLLEERL